MDCENAEILSGFLIQHQATLRSLRLFNFRLWSDWQPVVDAVRDAGCNLTSFSFRYLEFLPNGVDGIAQQQAQATDWDGLVTASFMPPRYAFNHHYPNHVLAYMRGERDSPWPHPEEAHKSLKYPDEFYYRCYGDWGDDVDDLEGEWTEVHDQKYDLEEGEKWISEHGEDDEGIDDGDDGSYYSASESNYDSDYDSDYNGSDDSDSSGDDDSDSSGDDDSDNEGPDSHDESINFG